MHSHVLVLIALILFVTLVNTQNNTSAGVNAPLVGISSDLGTQNHEPNTELECTEYHTVVLGEIAFTIAGKRGLLLCELQKYNEGVNLDRLEPGQQLCMNRAGYVPPSNSDGSAKTVKSIEGQMCTDIAKGNGLDYERFRLINIGKDCEKPLPGGLDFFVTRGTDPTCLRFYTIVDGDNSAKIMNLNQLSEIQLRTINPGLALDPIFAGNRFCVFARGIGSPTSTGTQPPAITPTPVICTLEYTVVQGDTVFKIATSRGMTLTEITALNPDIPDLNNIVPGQKICLNQAGAIPPSDTSGLAVTVKSNGETCDSIATRNQITINVFQTLNKEVNCSTYIPADQAVYVTRGMSPTCKTFATIVPNDTSEKIAQANGITVDRLMILNPGLSMTIIYPELKFCVA